MAAYLIWLAGQRGPTAQIWRQDRGGFVGCENSKDKVLAQHRLSDDEAERSIKALSAKYPAPVIP